MGYAPHISRVGDWVDSNASPIAEAEWLDLMKRDPELVLDPKYGKCFAKWIGKPGAEEEGLELGSGGQSIGT